MFETKFHNFLRLGSIFFIFLLKKDQKIH